MNQYATRLLAMQQAPSHKLKNIGDQWQTPKPLAWGLFHRFAPMIGPVVIDLFADDCNALVANYYTAADNAMQQDWAGDSHRHGGACFANPPYSNPECDEDGNAITGMESILDYCREQRDLGAKIMLLIKAATSDGWWPEDADFIQFISGRIGFKAPNWYIPTDPVKDKPSSSAFASAVVIFDRDWKWERRPAERLNRDDLMTAGQIILDMIDARADQLVSQLQEPVHTEEVQISTENVDNNQESATTPSPVSTLHIYKNLVGQWAAKIMHDDLQVAAVGGLDSADEAMAAAEELGVHYDNIIIEQPVAELGTDDETPLNDQLPMPVLDEPQEEQEEQEEQVDPSFLQVVTKSLPELFFDYNNGDLACDNWTRFVITMTVLFGQQDTYTVQQIRFALCICDETNEQEYTSISDDNKERIRKCSMVVTETEKHMPLNDEERQLAVISCLNALDKGETTALVDFIKLARNVVTKSRCEVTA